MALWAVPDTDPDQRIILKDTRPADESGVRIKVPWKVVKRRIEPLSCEQPSVMTSVDSSAVSTAVTSVDSMASTAVS